MKEEKYPRNNSWANLHARNGWTRQKIQKWRKRLAAKGRTVPGPDEDEAWRDIINVDSRVRITEELTSEETMRELGREKHLLTKEQRIERQIKNAKALLQHYDADRMERYLRNLSGIFYGELDRVFQELPQVLVGRDQHDINTECVKERDNIKTKVRQSLEQWHAENEQLKASNTQDTEE